MTTPQDTVNGASAVMPTSPRPAMEQKAQQQRAFPTNEEVYDPLPYKRSNLPPQQHQDHPSQQPFFSQNQQQLQYDQYQWPGTAANPNRLENSSETRESRPSPLEQTLISEEDSNPIPIPIQPRYPPLYTQQQQQLPLELGKEKMGQDFPGMLQPQQFRKMPNPGSVGENNVDSFQGRHFYPPQQQQPNQIIYQPHQQVPPPNPNYFPPQFKPQPPILAPRGSTPIPTAFVQNQIGKKGLSRISTKKDDKTTLEITAKTRKRPWHRRSLPDDSIGNKDTNDTTSSTPSKACHSYVAKVHQMLEDAPTKGFDHIVSWQPHGRAFKIHKPSEFVEEILPKYFETKKLAHFMRWLGAWGFVKHREGADRDAIYHRYFVRGVVVSLVLGLSRNEMFESMQGWLRPGEVPDFCSGGTLSEQQQSNTHDKGSVNGELENDEAVRKTIGNFESHHKNPRRLRGTLLETVRQMLDEAIEQKFDHIVSWLPGGRSFKVHDTAAFQEKICGKYLQTNLLRSFSDSLRTWGFCRLWEANGIEKNAYYHRLFRQGMPHLCRHYSRAQMLNEMKDFREEQKHQKEISWSLFPRHRVEHQKQKRHQNGATVHKMSRSSSLNELANVATAGNVGEMVFVGQGDDISDDEDTGARQGPIAINEAAIPNSMTQPQDYLMPYLDMPNENSTNAHKNENHRNIGAMDISMRQSYGESYSMDPSYQIIPPNTIGKTAAASLSSKDDPNQAIEIQKPPATTRRSNSKKAHDFLSQNDRKTGLSYVIRISTMLDGVEKNGNKHIISWRSHGRAFKIHDEKAFESKVLPRYFSATSLASFHRWLNKWGFLRIRSGKDRRCWYHRLFVRGVVDLLKGYTQRQMFDLMEDWRAPGNEPDFYCPRNRFELSILSQANKRPKIGKSNHSDGNSSSISDEKKKGIKSQLLQPQIDPKSLRGTLLEKIREMLDSVKEEGNDHIVSWLPHGKAFKIHNQKLFRESIMHRFFGVSKYRYFGDILRSWGFVILKNGKDKGAFYHKCFVQNNPRLSLHLSRTQLKASMKDWKKDTTTDFYKEQKDETSPNENEFFPLALSSPDQSMPYRVI